MKGKKAIIFDLDDTLVWEIDFLKSAFHEIADRVDGANAEALYGEMMKLYYEREDVFSWLNCRFPKFEKKSLLDAYRNHYPTLTLNEETRDVLNYLRSKRYILGIITDGRSVTQRNKLKALSIDNYFNEIVISEEIGSSKPHPENYRVFNNYRADDYYYIGDNVQKDFITPNRMGWKTICMINKGYNIHPQDFCYPSQYLPQYTVESIRDVIKIIEMDEILLGDINSVGSKKRKRKAYKRNENL